MGWRGIWRMENSQVWHQENKVLLLAFKIHSIFTGRGKTHKESYTGTFGQVGGRDDQAFVVEWA